jgi:hypothetical protein
MLHLTLIIPIALFAGCRAHPNDQQIQSDIQAKAAADPDIQGSSVTVESKDGKVAISGKVKSDTASKKLDRIAKDEPGVSDVVDETTVDTAPAESGPVASAAAAPAVQPAAAPAPPPPPPPPPKPVVVPAGTVLTIYTTQPLSSKESQPGQAFSGSLAHPIVIDGKEAIPEHSEVFGHVRDAKKAGKFKGGASLALTLTGIRVKGQKYNIVTDDAAQETKGKGKRTAGLTIGGAGAGAAIGGLAGGGKGAAIGALAGVTAGAIGAATTGNNKDINLPPETSLTFALQQSLTLAPSSRSE